MMMMIGIVTVKITWYSNC